MTYLDKPTARTPVFSLLFASLLVAIPQVRAQDLTEISKVSLLVSDFTATKPTSGLLYRAHLNRREYVAEIDEEGKLDRPVKCSATEKFEAQAESALDRPIAPTPLKCSKIMNFTFTRTFAVSFPIDQPTQLAGTASKPFVYGGYADIFAKAGKPTAAKAWSDAAAAATAKTLGDKNLDKFVYRDPSGGFPLKFTPEGITALKAKQKDLGIPQTGELDTLTQAALAKDPTNSINPTKVPGLRCSTRGMSTFVCEPFKGTYAINTPTTVYLPKVEIQ